PPAPSPVPLPRIDQPHIRWLPLRGLSLQEAGIGVRRQRDDPKPLALAGQHLQSGAADRARGPEDRDADAHATPNRRSNPAVAGRTKYRESRRSSTPPWPGISADESLTRSEEHTSELQSLRHLVCRLLLEKKKRERDTKPQL